MATANNNSEVRLQQLQFIAVQMHDAVTKIIGEYASLQANAMAMEGSYRNDRIHGMRKAQSLLHDNAELLIRSAQVLPVVPLRDYGDPPMDMLKRRAAEQMLLRSVPRQSVTQRTTMLASNGQDAVTTIKVRGRGTAIHQRMIAAPGGVLNATMPGVVHNNTPGFTANFFGAKPTICPQLDQPPPTLIEPSSTILPKPSTVTSVTPINCQPQPIVNDITLTNGCASGFGPSTSRQPMRSDQKWSTDEDVEDDNDTMPDSAYQTQTTAPSTSTYQQKDLAEPTSSITTFRQSPIGFAAHTRLYARRHGFDEPMSATDATTKQSAAKGKKDAVEKFFGSSSTNPSTLPAKQVRVSPDADLDGFSSGVGDEDDDYKADNVVENIRPLQRKFSRYHGDQGKAVIVDRTATRVISSSSSSDGDRLTSCSEDFDYGSDDDDQKKQYINKWLDATAEADISNDQPSDLECTSTSLVMGGDRVGGGMSLSELEELAARYATVYPTQPALFSPNAGVRCFITQHDGPLDLSVLPTDMDDKVVALERQLANLQVHEKVDEIIEHLLTKHESNLPCVVTDVDNKRLRARVEASGEKEAHVYLVDYGSQMWREKKHILPMPADFAVLPPAAYKIAIYGVDSRELNSDKVRQFNAEFDSHCRHSVVVTMDEKQKRQTNTRGHHLVDIWDRTCTQNLANNYKRDKYKMPCTTTADKVTESVNQPSHAQSVDNDELQDDVLPLCESVIDQTIEPPVSQSNDQAASPPADPAINQTSDSPVNKPEIQSVNVTTDQPIKQSDISSVIEIPSDQQTSTCTVDESVTAHQSVNHETISPSVIDPVAEPYTDEPVSPSASQPFTQPVSQSVTEEAVNQSAVHQSTVSNTSGQSQPSSPNIVKPITPFKLSPPTPIPTSGCISPDDSEVAAIFVDAVEDMSDVAVAHHQTRAVRASSMNAMGIDERAGCSRTAGRPSTSTSTT